MSKLAQAQARLFQAIREGGPVPADIADQPPLSPEQRLEIYANAYGVRLDEALMSNYPRLHRLLGDEVFAELGAAYRAAHPSRHRSIRWFGDALVEFLHATPRFAAVPVIAELASLDWALGLAFDAADVPALDITALTRLNDDDWPGLQVQFHPSLRLLVFSCNAVPIWQALDSDAAPPAQALGEKSHWVVWRTQLELRYQSIPVDEAALLDALLRGQRLEAACATLTPWHDDDNAPVQAATWLGQWLGHGWICRLNAVRA